MATAAAGWGSEVARYGNGKREPVFYFPSDSSVFVPHYFLPFAGCK